MAEIIPMTEEQKFQLEIYKSGHEPERSRGGSISIHWH